MLNIATPVLSFLPALLAEFFGTGCPGSFTQDGFAQPGSGLAALSGRWFAARLCASVPDCARHALTVGYSGYKWVLTRFDECGAP